MDKFIRCFCYGLTPGESVTVNIEGNPVAFSYENPQVDVPITAPADGGDTPAPAPIPNP